MKKIIIMILLGTVILTLSACGEKNMDERISDILTTDDNTYLESSSSESGSENSGAFTPA